MSEASNNEDFQNPGPEIRVDVSKEDYIGVAPGGRYFVHPDGRFYTPIGYNHNPDWAGIVECSKRTPYYNPEITEAFFKKLHDNRINLIRLMIEAPGGKYFIENPIGTFVPEQVRWMDTVVQLARKYNIKLMLTPWDTFWMGHLWDDNPYNKKNGGFVDARRDFITKRAVIRQQKRRWQYIIDRWGNTGTIFAWELLNESDYWWESTPDEVIVWAREMSDFVRSYEHSKWGRNHLITISCGFPTPKDGWDNLAYSLPGIDLATTHLYIGASNEPTEPVAPAKTERKGVTYSLNQIKDNRPYIDGENGPINKWIADENLDNRVFHNQSWAHLASGGAGSSLRWPYRSPHHLTDGMYHALSLMSKFAESVPWKKLCAPSTPISVPDPDGGVACGTATRDAAIVWIAAKDGTKLDKGTIEISWSDGPKTVTYRLFDTHSGVWLRKGILQSANGKYQVPLVEVPSVAIILEDQ